MQADLKNRIDSLRLARWFPPFACILVVLFLLVFSLGSYWYHYFPYEDDFSLIRHSAVQNSPAPITWITKGFTDYFANDPECATRFFGFDRPVVNATFYLESLLYRSAEGPFLMLTNVLCWILSAWLVYAIARRLGASNWVASSGILLYALSPCWYRILIHSSFRNNGLSSCLVLAAWYVLLKPDAVRSWTRPLLAGVLVAVASGAHEQGITSLPVLAVGMIWLSYKAEGRWRAGRISLSIGAVALPSILMMMYLRAMNPMYGTSYMTGGPSGTLTQSRRLAALHIHNPIVIATAKLTARMFVTLVGSMTALTPLGTENLTPLTPVAGWILFITALTASIAIVRRHPSQMLPLGAWLLYALGRSFGVPSAEPRFMQIEVAWGIVALLCAVSIGLNAANRLAIFAGTAAMAGLVLFTAYSFDVSVLMRRHVLNDRAKVDRQSFYSIQAAASAYPGAQVILVNDQAGIESSRDMLLLAGVKRASLELLPSILNGPSMDALRKVTACQAETDWKRLGNTLEIRLDYPKGCAVTFFGRDFACMAAKYQAAGRFHSATWAAYLEEPETQGFYPSPLIDDVPVEPGRPLLLIVWRNRLTAPHVTSVAREEDLPLDWQPAP